MIALSNVMPELLDGESRRMQAHREVWFCFGCAILHQIPPQGLVLDEATGWANVGLVLWMDKIHKPHHLETWLVFAGKSSETRVSEVVQDFCPSTVLMDTLSCLGRMKPNRIRGVDQHSISGLQMTTNPNDHKPK